MSPPLSCVATPQDRTPPPSDVTSVIDADFSAPPIYCTMPDRPGWDWIANAQRLFWAAQAPFSRTDRTGLDGASEIKSPVLYLMS